MSKVLSRHLGRGSVMNAVITGIGRQAARSSLCVFCQTQLRQRARTVTSDARTSFPEAYSRSVEAIRKEEYPHMNSSVYLDHSGATIYPRSMVENLARKLTTGLYGNPHSANAPAKLSGDVVDRIRAEALRFLGADPRYFDLVFVANATAAIKLVADAFRDLAEKTRTGAFWYGYHKEAHTSLVGVRELARGDHHCFESDSELEAWLANPYSAGPGPGQGAHSVVRRDATGLGLLAWPGQSNLGGRRLPTMAWAGRLRESRPLQNTYSLLDCAALAATAPLGPRVFADAAAAPDFACVSFYKIFGLPDLGGLVVRRDSGHVLALRRYFGGGTVTMVSALGGSGAAWHKSKALDNGSSGWGGRYELHDGLEDGTLPFHNILALGEAMATHRRLYGSMAAVSRHTTALVRRLYEGMRTLQHEEASEEEQEYGSTKLGPPVCRVYSEGEDGFGDATRQGATIAFNVIRRDGSYVPYADVEKLANARGIFVRSGGICCPGGLFTALQYEPWELERARSAGHHCGSDGLSLIHHLPTGVVRASLGAMSTAQDVDTFLAFLRDTFVERAVHIVPEDVANETSRVKCRATPAVSCG